MNIVLDSWINWINSVKYKARKPQPGDAMRNYVYQMNAGGKPVKPINSPRRSAAMGGCYDYCGCYDYYRTRITFSDTLWEFDRQVLYGDNEWEWSSKYGLIFTNRNRKITGYRGHGQGTCQTFNPYIDVPDGANKFFDFVEVLESKPWFPSPKREIKKPTEDERTEKLVKRMLRDVTADNLQFSSIEDMRSFLVRAEKLMYRNRTFPKYAKELIAMNEKDMKSVWDALVIESVNRE